MEPSLFSDSMTSQLEQSTTFRDYMRVLFRQKAVVLTAVFTVVVTVFLGLTLKTPVYEAQVKMLISAEKLVQAPYYRELLGGRNVEESLTQSEIVKSAPVLERVAQALGLSKKPEDYEKRYASPLKGKLIDLSLKAKQAQMTRYTPEQQQLLAFRAAVEDLRARIKVEPVRDTNLFTISVSEFDPIGAAVTANVVSRSYVIFDLEQQLADLTLKYGEKHPTVLQLKDSIDKMLESLNGNPVSNIEAIGPATVKVVEQANVPLEPKGPRKMLVMLLGVVMSVFLGVMLAFVFEYMDPTIKSPREIEVELNLPFLGSVPRRRLGEKVLLPAKPKKSMLLHYYQVLADQLHLLLKDRQLRTVMVTSSGAQEGTSTIIANLGMLLAQKAGHHVLLVDGNFRQPSLHKLLKIDNAVGLADVLEGRASTKQATHETNTNLHVIPAGKTELNPVILLDSGKLDETLDEVKKKYEVILIDCPNMKSYKDALVLAGHTDATVVVVNEGKTRRQVLKAALQPFEERKVNMVGVVLNNRTFPIPKFVYERV